MWQTKSRYLCHVGCRPGLVFERWRPDLAAGERHGGHSQRGRPRPRPPRSLGLVVGRGARRGRRRLPLLALGGGRRPEDGGVDVLEGATNYV